MICCELLFKSDIDKSIICLFQGDTEEGPGKELTDIAAQALSLQPRGYTLQTTEVTKQSTLKCC